MQPKAYRKEQAFGDLKETVFKAYIVLIRRQGGNLGLLLLQSTLDELASIFGCVLSKLHSTRVYHGYSQVDITQLQSLFKLPKETLEGEGAVAIRTFAHLKAELDKKALFWSCDLDWDRPVAVGSWGDLTYALLEKLVKDGLATDSLCSELLARDLGL